MLQNGIILSELNEFDKYECGDNYQSIVDEDWAGNVEFVEGRRELQHLLGWDYGVDFILPSKVICSRCKSNLIDGVDPATFYGESDKQQDKNGLMLLEAVEQGMMDWSSGNAVHIRRHNCQGESSIES